MSDKKSNRKSEQVFECNFQASKDTNACWRLCRSTVKKGDIIASSATDQCFDECNRVVRASAHDCVELVKLNNN